MTNINKVEFKIGSKSTKTIAIIGLMGVGKTTLGSKLADKLGYYFVDSDHEIEDLEQKSISEIFEEKGEDYFRNLEKNIIKDIIERDEAIILSLGGGAFMNEETRNLLQKKAIIIWLHAPPDVILHRLSGKNNRPLLNGIDRRQILQDLTKKRYPIYAMADIEIDTSSASHDATVNKIIKLLNNEEN